MCYYKKAFLYRALVCMALVVWLSSMCLSSSVYAQSSNSGLPSPIGSQMHGRVSYNIKYSGGTKLVTVVWVDLGNPLMQMQVVPANNKIGATAPLKSIAASVTNDQGSAIGAINGSFFNAYSDLQPAGTLLENGDLLHINNVGSLFAVDANNRPSILRANIFIDGGSSDLWTWPNNWYAWNINHFYNSNDAIMIFDAQYNGPKPSHGFTGISVTQGIVTKVAKGSWDIPKDGFLILTQNKTQTDLLKVGMKCDYRLRYEDTTSAKGSLNTVFSNISSAVGAGPTVLKAGVVVDQAVLEGFTEAKITQNRATRSLIGIRSSRYVGLAVINSVSAKELGEIAKGLGMTDAMNLDGGASSALVYQSTYVSGPGRNISNAIVFKQLKNRPVDIRLNTVPLLDVTKAYFDSKINSVMVPIDALQPKLGISTSLVRNAAGSVESIQFKRLNVVATLKKGEAQLWVGSNDEASPLPTSFVSIQNELYIPAKVLNLAFGADLTWDTQNYVLSIGLDNEQKALAEGLSLKSAQNWPMALIAFERVLAFNENNELALTALADYYLNIQKNIDKASQYQLRLIALSPQNASRYQSLAWAYYGQSNLDKAKEIFTAWHLALPLDPNALYGQALCYSHYAVGNVAVAKSIFSQALGLGLTGDAKVYAEQYIKTH